MIRFKCNSRCPLPPLDLKVRHEPATRTLKRGAAGSQSSLVSRRRWRRQLSDWTVRVALAAGTLLGLGTAVGFAQTVTGSRLRDAILERETFAPETLANMDLNADEMVDVADLVQRASVNMSLTAEGQWLAVVGLNERSMSGLESNRLLSASVAYAVHFVLAESDGQLTGQISAYRGFDPTTPILEQIGNSKWQTRSEYAVSPAIPVGFPVSASLDRDTETLHVRVQGLLIGSGTTNSLNPFPVSMRRDVDMVFTTLPAPGAFASGYAQESTVGLCDGDTPLVLAGGAYLFFCGDGSRAGNGPLATSPASIQHQRLIEQATSDARIDMGDWENEREPAPAFREVSSGDMTTQGGAHPVPSSFLVPPSDGLLFASARYRNSRTSMGSPDDPQAVHLGGGGYVFRGAGASEAGAARGTILGLGQPFAGMSCLPDAETILAQQAWRLLAVSTAFYADEAVVRGTRVISQPADFYPATLAKAERHYAGLAIARPYDDSGVLGIIECRIRAATAWNHMCDQNLLRLYQEKFVATNANGSAILAAELAILADARSHAARSAGSMLALYADPQFRGVGAFLRQEAVSIQVESSLTNKLDEAVRMTVESVRRLAEVRLQIAEKRLVRSFFTPSERLAALAEIDDLQGYLAEAIRVICAFGTGGYGEYAVGVLVSKLEQGKSLASAIQAGFNHLGFHPDFVPFLQGNDFNDHRSTVSKLMDFADGVIDRAAVYENDSRNASASFTTDWNEYRTRITEVKESANERLKALCGVVRNPNPTSESPEFQPDIFTFIDPDTSRRNEMLAGMLPGWTPHSYGLIAIQFQNIANAHDRIQQAVNEMVNLVREMEINQQAAYDVVNNMSNLAEFHLKTGARVGVLLRQKSSLAQQEEIEKANASRKNSLFGIANELTRGHLEKVMDGMPSDARGPLLLVGAMVSHDNFSAAPLVDSYLDVKNILDQARISGDYAVAQADIDAAIEEIRTIQAAEVIFSQRREVLIRNEEQLKILALRQANLALAVQIAQRDAIREEMQLADMVAEVVSLISDMARRLRQEDELSVAGGSAWYPDWRAVFYASQSDAEASFRQAQAACYLVLRALDYHLNRSQNLAGLYQSLYAARRVSHLQDLLRGGMNSVAASLLWSEQNLATGTPVPATLSLKYDILSRQVASLNPDGTPIEEPAADMFTYSDPVSGAVLHGAAAYQAKLRDFLKDRLTRTPRPAGGYNYVLQFEFATDLMKANDPVVLPDGTIVPRRENRFWGGTRSVNQVIIAPNPTAWPDFTDWGISINMTGNGLPTHGHCWIELTMSGNLYQRYAEYDPTDPMAGMIMYSTYEQQFPAALRLPNDTAPPLVERFVSSRYAGMAPRINGQAVTGSPEPQQPAYTDRAVACDRWVVRIASDQGNENMTFLATLWNRVHGSAPFDYVTDIQFKIGWIAKFMQN